MIISKLTKEQAEALWESGWWKDKTPREICDFQLFEERLCMGMGDFQLALEKALGRPVFTHELGMNYEGIVKEYLGEKAAPTFEEVLALIPEAKRIVVVT